MQEAGLVGERLVRLETQIVGLLATLTSGQDAARQERALLLESMRSFHLDAKEDRQNLRDVVLEFRQFVRDTGQQVLALNQNIQGLQGLEQVNSVILQGMQEKLQTIEGHTHAHEENNNNSPGSGRSIGPLPFRGGPIRRVRVKRRDFLMGAVGAIALAIIELLRWGMS